MDQAFTLTDGFCAEYPDEEHAALCRKLVAKLARKRPSPLLRGDLRIWAGGILHAAAKSTRAAKSRTIREALRLRDHDPDFCQRELLAHHPWAWFWLPPHLRDAADRKGLIPAPTLLEGAGP